MSEQPEIELEVASVIDLAVRLGYGRGGRRGCGIPFEELRRLRETMSDDELDALVESVHQADQAEQEATAHVEAEAPRRALPLPRRWFWRR